MVETHLQIMVGSGTFIVVIQKWGMSWNLFALSPSNGRLSFRECHINYPVQKAGNNSTIGRVGCWHFPKCFHSHTSFPSGSISESWLHIVSSLIAYCLEYGQKEYIDKDSLMHRYTLNSSINKMLFFLDFSKVIRTRVGMYPPERKYESLLQEVSGLIVVFRFRYLYLCRHQGRIALS